MAQNFNKVFNSETEFEQAFITLLTVRGETDHWKAVHLAQR